MVCRFCWGVKLDEKGDQNSRLRCLPTRIHVITFPNNTMCRTSFVFEFKNTAQRATEQGALWEAGLRVCWEAHGNKPSRPPRLVQFLGALAKLRKGTGSLLMSPSVRMQQLGSHWTDFHEI
jgi:hypothetical protein